MPDVLLDKDCVVSLLLLFLQICLLLTLCLLALKVCDLFSVLHILPVVCDTLSDFRRHFPITTRMCRHALPGLSEA
jgi:hypothetical protein